ncbi:AAA family ATPase [Paracoccus nototheniae]|uniref:AAA family ATPase n=1 Tax=Paracoccus nototheniae TaxID=2489002 RepID=A0ABW4DXT7_9RHOB|nr:AAA family ATPase [Paracoccus nototheniae]
MNIFNAYGEIDQSHRASVGYSRDPGGPSDEGRRSRFYSASDLEGRDVPAREWLVPDMIPSGTVTLLGGDGGTGKSLLALQLAKAVATASRWLGYQTASGPVLFISAEDDDDELHRRTSDIVRATGGHFSDLDRLVLRSLAGEDALLAFLDRQSGVLSPTSLYAEIEARIEEEKPVLIVLDTLADLFPGNENDRAQARQFIGLLRGWAIRHSCAVVLLAHPSLSGLNSGSGTSGSTGWNNSVRSRLYLERIAQEGYEANPDARVLRTMKANYGRTGGEINMTWKDGVFAPDQRESGLDRMAASARAERVFLKLLRMITEQGRRVNDKGSASYAPKQFAEHPNAEGITKRAFKTAMEAMLADGRLIIDSEGPASRRVSYLAEGSR